MAPAPVVRKEGERVRIELRETILYVRDGNLRGRLCSCLTGNYVKNSPSAKPGPD